MRKQGSITSDRSTLMAPESPSSSSASSSSSSGGEGAGVMQRMVAENPVVVVGRRGCCMCYVARRLLLGLGVNPAVCEFEETAAEADRVVDVEVPGGDLRRPMTLPAVFVGGRLLGGLDRLVAVHITGELVPILKEAGALWL
ncbi:monothiol glutaredoxin-S9-like [Zingiber officinale]|nr:monothiol glutaredoxin-S9-like [Zingiber officinale]